MRTTLLLLSLLVVTVVSTAPAGDISVPDNNPATGAACNAIPWSASFMGGEARYQALVPAKMMGGQPALLYELAFAPCAAPNTLTATTLVITFAHTTMPSLSSTWANNLQKDATVMYNGVGAYTGTQNQWSPIGLTNTFLYNGVDNLVVEVKYKASATGGFSCWRSSNIERGWRTGAGAFSNPTASSVGSMAALKMQFLFHDIRIVLTGKPTPGGTVSLMLEAPPDGGLPYQAASSFGQGPIMIGSRALALSPDALMGLSTSGLLPTVFKNFAGILDKAGKGQADVVLPNTPLIKGLRIYNAFVTVDARAPFGLKSISQSVMFLIQ
jgi:hypothetical protein